MEYYWALKRNEELIRATTWLRLEHIMLGERSQSQNITYCMIHLCKMSRRGKSIEMESRLMVLGIMGREEWE